MLTTEALIGDIKEETRRQPLPEPRAGGMAACTKFLQLAP